MKQELLCSRLGSHILGILPQNYLQFFKINYPSSRWLHYTLTNSNSLVVFFRDGSTSHLYKRIEFCCLVNPLRNTSLKDTVLEKGSLLSMLHFVPCRFYMIETSFSLSIWRLFLMYHVVFRMFGEWMNQ